MEELFTITILHNGVEKELAGKLRISAYTHQFIFTIGESEIVVEKDDEGNLRALTASSSSGKPQNIDPSLVQALINEMGKEIE
ncbi:MAG: hypothetical protein Q8918_14625 [Bacteroidota bacterium]|nr:hypothetical protein [Bacteroidota bacterium]MDP4213917.1 hypothetical protein [Bacteroidota bacterium]MDP4251336.1 hypothetical protein [Bacteroidota bacterium]